MAKTKILITGGLGYIGSHTASVLHEQGYEPILVDNLDNSELRIYEGLAELTGRRFSFYKEDVCQEGVLDKIIDEEGPIYGIIHFAAHKAVGESVLDPLKYYENNLTGLLRVLRVLEKYSIPKFVFSSSCTVYGDEIESPVKESAPVQIAASPYGNTKKVGEEIIADFCAATQRNVVSLRYFNPVGAHPSSRIGELPLGVPNNLVPFITQTAAGLRDKLTVFGDDYNTPDGTCIRDYIHVMDLADAHVKALEFQGASGMEVFNIGRGIGSSVLEVIQAFEEATGVDLPYELGPRRPGDVEQIWADKTKATQKLGWIHQYTLQDMMKHAWAWQNRLD
jgi:UDP-glucose 4-epimerase